MSTQQLTIEKQVAVSREQVRAKSSSSVNATVNDRETGGSVKGTGKSEEQLANATVNSREQVAASTDHVAAKKSVKGTGGSRGQCQGNR